MLRTNWNRKLAPRFRDALMKIEALGTSIEHTNAIKAVEELMLATQRELDAREEVLNDCDDYFEERMDADHDGQSFIPNREMAMSARIKVALGDY